MSGHPRYFIPIEIDLTLSRIVDARDEVKNRGLTCAIRPDDTENLSQIDAERYFLNCFDATEVHRQINGLQQAQCKRSVRRKDFCRL